MKVFKPDFPTRIFVAIVKWSVVAHAFDPSTQLAEAGKLLQCLNLGSVVSNQPRLEQHSKTVSNNLLLK